MIINKYILYIYIIHGKHYSANYSFIKFITTFIRQLRRWNEIENRKCTTTHKRNLDGFLSAFYRILIFFFLPSS